MSNSINLGANLKKNHLRINLIVLKVIFIKKMVM